jgi:hypothetical protein
MHGYTKFNLSVESAKRAVGGAKLLTAPCPCHTMSLAKIGMSKIEHPASSFHDDRGDIQKHHLPNPALVEKFISYSKDGKYLDWDDMVRFRVDRSKEAIDANPNMTMPLSSSKDILWAEQVLLMEAIGHGKLDVDALRSFVLEEKLPAGWCPRAKTISVAEVEEHRSKLRKADTALFNLGLPSSKQRKDDNRV